MNRFDYVRAADVADAVRLAAGAMADSASTIAQSYFLAGGTNLVDLRK